MLRYYYLILQLPFDVVLKYHEAFGSEEEAVSFAASLPPGFIVTTEVPDGAITVPMEKKRR